MMFIRAVSFSPANSIPGSSVLNIVVLDITVVNVRKKGMKMVEYKDSREGVGFSTQRVLRLV